MKVDKRDFQWATQQGLITAEQARNLWKALEARSVESSVNLPQVAYYFGAMVVIAAMGWLMGNAWEAFHGGGIFLLAVLYAVLFAIAGQNLWSQENLQVPGGLLVTMAVCMAPLAIYGLEMSLGVWPQGDPGHYSGFHFWVKGSWFFMEVGTILAGLIALKFIPFALLSAPIAFTLWYMSMDLTPLLYGKDDFSYQERLWVSLLFGLVMLGVSYLMDRRTKEDYAYWGYLFGMFAFWGGMSLMESTSEFSKFLYCLINLGLILLSVFLERRVFVVFGAVGVNIYLGHLAYSIFKDSALFPLVLTFFGVAIIYCGVQYQRNRDRIETFLLDLFPADLRDLRPVNRVPAGGM